MKKTSSEKIEIKEPKITTKEAIDFALNLKKQTLKSIPTRIKTYSSELQQNIYTHLENSDP